MSRKKKLLLNIVSGLLFQIVTLVCGFILPRYFLMYYGSEVNGLVSSISQFLAFITLAECGVGAVVQSALYKPLAEKDEAQISRIIKSADKFFKKIALILVVYIIGLTIIYPLFVSSSFDILFTISLILVVSISLFVQYFISMSYKLLMNADQIGFINLFVQIVVLILNTIVCILLMKNGVGIQYVKLTTALLHLIPPIFIVVYIKKHYKINKRIEITEEPIKQKWNGMAQHVSAVILQNTDVIVLTIFASLVSVSIYNVYYLVVFGLTSLVKSVSTGTEALLGNMLSKNETEKMYKTFSTYEFAMHFIVTILFCCAGILIVPFVKVYTSGITDANYIVPLFASILTLAQAVYCLRIPYNTIVKAAGHYKQTQKSAIIEAALNVILSVILVINFGLVGVAIGTLVAVAYRTIYFVIYLRKDILNRKISHFIKHVIVDVVIVALSVLACWSFEMPSISYISWIILAIKCSLIVFAIAIVVNLIVYHKMIKDVWISFKNRVKKKSKLGDKNE